MGVWGKRARTLGAGWVVPPSPKRWRAALPLSQDVPEIGLVPSAEEPALHPYINGMSGGRLKVST